MPARLSTVLRRPPGQNDLNVYYLLKYLLTELTQVVRADGSIDRKDLEPLMPWSKDLPAEVQAPRVAALYLTWSEGFDLYVPEKTTSTSPGR